jgi:hypothetical protein
MNQPTRIPIKIKYSPDFRRIYCSGAYGAFNGLDFRISFFNDFVTQAEDPATAPIATREVQMEVILTPLAIKRLRDLLDKNVKEIEKLVGEIKVPERPGVEPMGSPYL